jgi:hypothetical protein
LKGQEEAIACRRVKLASPLSSAREGEAQVDYALLQLGRLSSRKPMLVAPAASQLANTRLTLFGINPSESLHTLRRFECQSSQTQEFVRKHIDPMRAFVMPGCPAVIGNSGGPILDEQGLVIGVISFVETPSTFAAAHGSPGGAVGSRLGLPTPTTDR